MADEKEIQRQFDAIVKGAEEVISADELRAKIAKSIETGKPLVAKLGADPTAPDIHLGHTVVLTKLRHIQELGHQVVFLIGDMTGRVGDPTGRSETRKTLTEDEVMANAETYRKQIYKVLDPARTQIRLNSEWLGKLDFTQVLFLLEKYTVARLLERDDFAKRFSTQQPISMHELMYPLMQGYDSVALHSDIELGGTDQKFNLLVGRDLQRAYGQPAQAIITMPILEGLDGKQKMSKSLKNYIGINEAPKDIYGKTMSISDEQMFKWYLLLTDKTAAEVAALRAEKRHPMELKRELAHIITKRFHGAQAADDAAGEFSKVHQKGELPSEMKEIPIASLPDEIGVVDLFVLAFPDIKSKSEVRRKVPAGAVKLDGNKVADEHLKLKKSDIRAGTVLQYGKLSYAKLV